MHNIQQTSEVFRTSTRLIFEDLAEIHDLIDFELWRHPSVHWRIPSAGTVHSEFDLGKSTRAAWHHHLRGLQDNLVLLHNNINRVFSSSPRDTMLRRVLSSRRIVSTRRAKPGSPGVLYPDLLIQPVAQPQWRGFNVPNQGGNPFPDPCDAAEEQDAKTRCKSLTCSTTRLVGYSYTVYYKSLVLKKIDNAFKPGDPVLDLVAGDKNRSESDVHWIHREEQSKIDAIVDGSLQGSYYLIVGEKGTGKSSMLLEAMQRVNGEGISMMDAHGDIEIFRIRLGRALDFEYHEDNIGSLFSIRGPRESSALLDVERAFNKLQKVALKRRAEQRAEQWCAANLVTIVMNSDEYWVYERLKQHATRMEVLPVADLQKDKAMQALKKHRKGRFNEDASPKLLEDVYDMIGGRMAYLTRVAKAPDMIQACQDICRREKTWFLNQCWILGEPMDDDVMGSAEICRRSCTDSLIWC
ncbi:hypothetical protein MRB53_039283 [Persea americana]|nr:hypothetical protein MRB53_039283 [Persea americana]